tara:strand:- start:174 stop:338 length:165 start_codon:yes stop_codon:yes gene_type:complete
MGAHKPNERMKKKGGGMGRMMYNKGTTKKNKMPRYGLVNGGNIVKGSMPIAPKS